MPPPQGQRIYGLTTVVVTLSLVIACTKFPPMCWKISMSQPTLAY